MNPLWSRLGVQEWIPGFFNAEEPLFNYGDAVEYFDGNGHYVPVTRNLWVAGNIHSREVVLTASAMDAVAYLSLNHSRYHAPESLAFIALGNRPVNDQVCWIRENFKKRRFTLVFEKAITGIAADIKVAALLKGHSASISLSSCAVQVAMGDRRVSFQPERLSLHAFERAFALRTHIRTSKPKQFNTFLDQLRYGNE
jgi:hypothetical protein